MQSRKHEHKRDAALEQDAALHQDRISTSQHEDGAAHYTEPPRIDAHQHMPH